MGLKRELETVRNKLDDVEDQEESGKKQAREVAELKTKNRQLEQDIKALHGKLKDANEDKASKVESLQNQMAQLIEVTNNSKDRLDDIEGQKEEKLRQQKE